MIRRPLRCVLSKPNVFLRKKSFFNCLCVLRPQRTAQRLLIPKEFPGENGVTLKCVHDCFVVASAASVLFSPGQEQVAANSPQKWARLTLPMRGFEAHELAYGLPGLLCTEN